jgi:hypothetical protein
MGGAIMLLERISPFSDLEDSELEKTRANLQIMGSLLEDAISESPCEYATHAYALGAFFSGVVRYLDIPNHVVCYIGIDVIACLKNQLYAPTALQLGVLLSLLDGCSSNLRNWLHSFGKGEQKYKLARSTVGFLAELQSMAQQKREPESWISPFALQRSPKLNFRRVLCDLGRRDLPPMKFRCYALSQAAQS